MLKGRICFYKKKKNVNNVFISKNKNSLLTLSSGVILKDVFLFLKKKNKKWNINNIFKSKKNLPFHLTHYFRVQYSRGQNPSTIQAQETSLKKKKKENVNNVSKSKKILLSTFNLLKFKVQVQKTFLKKKKKENVSNVSKSKKNTSPHPSTYSSPKSKSRRCL
jgi:hypothetical protein